LRRDVCSSRDVKAGLDVVAIAVVKLFFMFISVMILSLPLIAIATVELTHSVNARLAILERAIVKAVLSVCPSFRHKCPDPGHLTSLTHRTACSIDPIQGSFVLLSRAVQTDLVLLCRPSRLLRRYYKLTVRAAL